MIQKVTKSRTHDKKVGIKANSFRVSMKTRIIIFSIAFFLLTICYILIGFDQVEAGTRKILSRVGIYTEEIKSVEIESSNYDDPGSWHVEKSAEWIGPNQAQVTFHVDSIIKTDDHYKDIILVLDVSGSMAGSKMNKALSDSKNLVEYLLEDQNNHVSIITFSNNSTILTPFSNDKDLVLSKLDIVATEDSTNYNAALLNVDEVMSDYIKQTDHDIVTLFLTDGYPNKDTPNQIATYTILKDKYPYMDINGVQYEMGKNVIDDLKRMTDAQWVADQNNLHNVLLEAAISPVTYEEFVLTDYVDDRYFKVDSINDISASKGNVTMSNNKITWNLGDKYVMGEDMTMTIKMSLKEEYETKEGFYPTNTKTEIVSKEKNEREKTSTLNDTPVLKNLYDVIYETNTPDGCTLSSIHREQYFNYQRVNQKTDELSCEGYVFKGWEIVEDSDLKRVNNDTFYMPGHDIHIRAVWSKQSIVKTMNGSVHEKITLYKTVENDAKNNRYAQEYMGVHQDSMDAYKSTEKIYYYSGDKSNVVNRNNVIFAGHCWEMIRTTDTGGVKLLYNGEVENNQCLDSRANHVGYNSSLALKLSSNYWYGTDYLYDRDTKTFRISGDIEKKTWSETTGTDLVGKYTCKLIEEDGTCSTLYLIASYQDDSTAYVYQITSSNYYAFIGDLYFNAKYGDVSSIGYMRGNQYNGHGTNFISTQGLTTSQKLLDSSLNNKDYWYADSVDWNVSASNRYTLLDAYQVSEESDPSELVGKYTFLNMDEHHNRNEIYYVVAENDGILYYKTLINGEMPSKYEPILYGDSINDNGDGTYTISNTESVTLEDWYRNYDNYNYKYTCNSDANTCEKPRYILRTTNAEYQYTNAGEKILLAKRRNGLNLEDYVILRKDQLLKNSDDYLEYKYTCNTTSDVCTDETLRLIVSYNSVAYNYVGNYYWGSNVTWDGLEYTVIDPIELENYNNAEALDNHRYFCKESGKKKCKSVAALYGNDSGFMYIMLYNGVLTSAEALEDMLTKNLTNSTIKIGVESWYKKYLLSFSSFIEDTIYCNDRSIFSSGSWNPNVSWINNPNSGYVILMNQKNAIRYGCEQVTDQFSTLNNRAPLAYPVGLMTVQEAIGYKARSKDHPYWLMTPYGTSAVSPWVDFVTTSEHFGTAIAINGVGVRPMISLVPGIEYIDGDGSRERPYYIETE